MERSIRTRARLRNGTPDVTNETFLDITSGQVPGGFRPTNAMLKVLQYAVSLDTDTSRRAWFRAAGYTRNLWYVWKKVPGFLEWWDISSRLAFQDYEQEWIKIGLKRMQSTNREAYYYWKEVGEKIFKYISTVVVKEDKSPEERALTEELLKMFTHENKLRQAKEITARCSEVQEDEVVSSEVVLVAESPPRSLEEAQASERRQEVIDLEALERSFIESERTSEAESQTSSLKKEEKTDGNSISDGSSS